MVSTSLTGPSSQPRGKFRERSALAKTPCPGEMRFLSQPQAPAPKSISVLCTSNGSFKGSKQSGFWRILVILTWLLKTVFGWGWKGIISSATDLDLSCACLWQPALVWRQFTSRSSQWARRELKCLGLTFIPPAFLSFMWS